MSIPNMGLEITNLQLQPHFPRPSTTISNAIELQMCAGIAQDKGNSFTECMDVRILLCINMK